MSNFTRPPRAPSGPDHQTAPDQHAPLSHPSQSQASFLTSSEEIAPARDALGAWLEDNVPGLDRMLASDIVLAASELFCNAFEHGDGGCRFDMRRADGRLTLTVTNDAPKTDLLPAQWWTMPDAIARCGRGLAVVRAVADSVRLATTDTTVSVAATFDLPTPTPPRNTPAGAVAV